MKKNYDAIIIGAGVIGTAVAFELSKKGFKTLNIDRNPSSGYGSTSASCAIIRVHYSTFEGCALAYEGYHYWKKWEEYLEYKDESGLAKFIECGCMIYQTHENDYLKNIIARANELKIPFEKWDPELIKSKLPIVDTRQFGPVKLPSDKEFGINSSKHLKGAIFFPTAGYINDPQLSAHNLQRASEEKGAHYLFNNSVEKIITNKERTSGIILKNGEKICAPIIVNVKKILKNASHKSTIDRLGNAKDNALKIELLRSKGLW